MKTILAALALTFCAAIAHAEPLKTLYDARGNFVGSAFATGPHAVRTAGHCVTGPLYIREGAHGFVPLTLVSRGRLDTALLHCPVRMPDWYERGATKPQRVDIRGAFPGRFEVSRSTWADYGGTVRIGGCVTRATSNAPVRVGFSGGPVLDPATGKVVGSLSSKSFGRSHFVHAADW